jgi:hypothetical protein
MLKAGGRNRAREAVREAIAETGIGDLDGILGKGGTHEFLEGTLWPIDGQIGAIEAALEWPAGTIGYIVERPAHADLTGTEHAIAGLVHEMDEADRRALIEMLKMAKKHVEASQAELARQQVKIDRQLRVVQGHRAD